MRKVYEILSVFPAIQRLLRKGYLLVRYVLFYKPPVNRIKTDFKIVDAGYKSSFFGYHDKFPEMTSGDTTYCLFHAANVPTHVGPDRYPFIDIILYDLKSREISDKFESRAFNWQQGSRLHWMSADRFIYNDFRADEGTGKYISKIVEVNSGEVHEIDHPVQDSFGGEYFLSIDYERLSYFSPEYGYACKKWDKKLSPHEQGIRIIYLKNYRENESELIVTISGLVKKLSDKKATTQNSYINHISISPKGDRFIFLFRYVVNGARKDVLFKSDLKGRSEILVENQHKMISHYSWAGNDQILVYMTGNSGFTGYHLLNYSTGEIQVIADEELQQLGDGHPSIDGPLLVTDTYPNRHQKRRLFLINMKNHKKTELGEFHSPLKYDLETRCDLHPRLNSRSGNVYVDAIIDNNRKLVCLNVSDEISQILNPSD